MAHFDLWSLLLLASFISGCRGDTEGTEAASKEENITLLCSISDVMDSKSCYRYKWTKYDTDADQSKVIVAWPKKIHNDQVAKWGVDKKGQMFLHLTKLQKSDEGFYGCELCQGWDCTLIRKIYLKVRDCKVLPSVWVPPGTTCKLECPVNTTLGQEGPQNISWVMLKGSTPGSITSQQTEINGTSLVIQAVTPSDSGWYRCSYMYGQTQRCFETKLRAQEEGEDVVEATTVPVTVTETHQEPTQQEAYREKESGATVIAVVVSAVFAVATIAALTAVLTCNRCNSQRVTQETETQPAGMPMEPVNGYECINPSSSDNNSNQRSNSLYEEIEDENMCTFHY